MEGRCVANDIANSFTGGCLQSTRLTTVARTAMFKGKFRATAVLDNVYPSVYSRISSLEGNQEFRGDY